MNAGALGFCTTKEVEDCSIQRLQCVMNPYKDFCGCAWDFMLCYVACGLTPDWNSVCAEGMGPLLEDNGCDLDCGLSCSIHERLPTHTPNRPLPSDQETQPATA